MFRNSAGLMIALAFSVSAWGAAPSGASAGTDVKVEAAKKAAQSWLTLVDGEKYPESWSAAAKAFQGAVSREDWATAVAGARAPLGKMLSRKFLTAEFTTSVPGAPEGNYVIIQFTTAFEKKAEAVETITPMQEADGSWKVSGYFIK